MRHRIAAFSAVVLTVGLISACGDDEQPASATDPTTTLRDTVAASTVATTAVEPATTMPPATYTVGTGDSLFAIAERHCVGMDDLVNANAWTDGADHVLLPGDSIALPAGACLPTATAPPTTWPDEEVTVDGDTRYLDEWIASGQSSFIDPYYSDNGLGFWDFEEPECNDAAEALYEFYQWSPEHRDPATVQAALGAMNDGAPSVAPTLAAWSTFSEQYYDIYVQQFAPFIAYGNGDNDAYAAALVDPEVVAMLDAWSGLQTTLVDIRDYIDDHCTLA